MKTIQSGISGYTAYPIGDSLTSSLNAIESTFEFFHEYVKNEIVDNIEIDIFGRGSSGLIIATIFGYKLLERYPTKLIKVIEIKKGKGEDDSHHSLSNFRWLGLTVFVDDFSCSGATILKSIEKVRTLDALFCFDYGVLCGSCGGKYKLTDEANIFKTLIYK